MAKVVIIGAGLTGICAAYNFEKNGFFDYKIFEKESQIGGLCRSIYQDGFTFDYTGHFLHLNDAHCLDLVKNIAGLENFNLISRQSFVYSHDKYTPYPYQTNLYGLPTEVIQDCICGFVQRDKYKDSSNNNGKNKSQSYHSWVMQNFGAGFGKNFFFPYQKKIFSYDTKKLRSEWTGRFVPQTSLQSLIKGCVQDSSESIGYNSKFYYPKTDGIYFLIKKLASNLINPINTNFCVKNIDTKNKIITFTNGDYEKYDILINTMPLNSLLENLEHNTAVNSLKNASSKLLCNSVVNFNFGIFSSKNYSKHWVYYPEEKYPFYRVGFFHNYSEHMAPPGCSSMYGEFSYLKKSKKFIQEKLNLCVNTSKKLLEIEDSEILTTKILDIKHAYVIYDMWREKNIEKIHKTLNKNNIYSIGRYGQWKYSSMQEAILDGKEIVEKLIGTNFEDQQKYWSIFAENILNKQKTL